MGSSVVACTVLVSTEDVSTSLFVVGSLSTCEVDGTVSTSTGVPGSVAVVAVCSVTELAAAAVV